MGGSGGPLDPINNKGNFSLLVVSEILRYINNKWCHTFLSDFKPCFCKIYFF